MRNAKRPQRTQSRRTTLNLETLEGRLLLSGNVVATLDSASHLLSIVGDIGNNAIHIAEINPFGTPLIRVSGDVVLPGPPPSLPDATTVNAVAFTDFDLASITSISITLLDGNNSVIVGGAGSGFTLPHNITINAGTGANTFAFTNINANVIAVTAKGPGANNISLESIQAGEADLTTGAGADTMRLDTVAIGTVNLNSGQGAGNDNVAMVNSPGTPPHAAIGVLTIASGDGSNTVLVSGNTTVGNVTITQGNGNDNVTIDTPTAGNVSVTAGNGNNVLTVTSPSLKVVTIKAGNGKNTISLDNTTLTSASITTGTGASSIDVSNDIIKGAAGLSLSAGVGGAAVQTVTLVGDSFTGGGNLSVAVGDGVSYWSPTPAPNGSLLPASSFIMNNDTGIGTANISLGKFFRTVTVGDTPANFVGAKALTLAVGDTADVVTVNTQITNAENITVGNLETFPNPPVPAPSVTVSGTAASLGLNVGSNGPISVTGTFGSLTANFGDNDTFTTDATVAGAVSITGGTNATLTVDSPNVGALAITAGQGATVSVNDVTAAGDIAITLGDNTVSAAVTATNSNNLTIHAGNGLGGTGSSYYYLNNLLVNNDFTLTVLDGNNTIALQSVEVIDALFAACGGGINTVFAGDTSCLFGNIDGGPGPASIFLDLGGNFGFSVGAFPPIINGGNLSLSATTINEGDSVTLTGMFFHPGNVYPHTVTINWGDGSANTIQSLAGGVFSFTSSHQYLNQGVDTINVTVTDRDGNTATANTSITVKDVAPVIPTGGLVVSPSTIKAGSAVTLTGTFTDPGILDPHTVVINWGDGSPATTLNLGANVLTFSTSHRYLINLPGNVPYTIVAAITDDDAQSGSATTSVTVQNLVPSINSVSPDSGVSGVHITSATALTLSGTAAAGSTVKLYVNGDYTSPVGTAVADLKTGAWSIHYTATTNTAPSFTATSTDPAGNTTAPSAPFVVTVAGTVFTPSGLINTDVPVFSWPIVAQAASYDVWLTDLTTGIGQITGSSTTVSLPAPAALSPGHSYRWWVRGNSSNGTLGPWSVSTDFAVTALAMPVPIAPSGTVSTTLPTFTWSAVALATKYDVWLTDTATGVGQVIGSSTTTSLTAPAALTVGHSYTWWVRGDSSNGTLGPWSVATDFTTAATGQHVVPTITTFGPDTGVVGDKITSATALTISGTAAPGDTVKVYVNGDYSTAASVTAANSLTGAWSFLYTAPANTTTSFTATGTNPAGNTTAPSAPFSVTVDTKAPTVVLSAGARMGPLTVFHVTATFSEAVTGLTVGGITAVGGTVSNLTGSGASYAFDVTPASSGAVTLSVAQGAAQDVAGNGNTAASLAIDAAVFTPIGLINTDLPVFSWPSVAQAVSYDVWLTDLSTGVGQVIGTATTTSLLAPAALSPGHAYRWWVRGESSAGTPSPWSAPIDFSVVSLAMPVSSGPSGAVSTDLPTFTWSSVDLATKYEVWLTDTVTGVGQVIGSSTTTSLAAPAALSPGHSYHWWVRGVSSNSTAGPWSAATDFTVTPLATPAASGPSGSINTVQPAFVWSAVPLATKYDVWLTDATTGVGQVIGSSTSTTLTAPTALTPGHSYQWWVRGDSNNGTSGAWNNATDFVIVTLASPVPAGPSGPTSVNPPTFTWSSVAQAVKYDLWVDDLTSGTSQLVRNQSVVGTSFTSGALAAGHSYRWWVRALGEDGIASAWSGPTDFVLAAETPALRRYNV